MICDHGRQNLGSDNANPLANSLPLGWYLTYNKMWHGHFLSVGSLKTIRIHESQISNYIMDYEIPCVLAKVRHCQRPRRYAAYRLPGWWWCFTTATQTNFRLNHAWIYVRFSTNTFVSEKRCCVSLSYCRLPKWQQLATQMCTRFCILVSIHQNVKILKSKLCQKFKYPIII